MTDRRTSSVLDRDRISELGGYLSIKKKLKIGALKLVSLVHPSATFLHEATEAKGSANNENENQDGAQDMQDDEQDELSKLFSAELMAQVVLDDAESLSSMNDFDFDSEIKGVPLSVLEKVSR